VVVSGDRRLQVAARRRRATAIASDEWLTTMREQRRQRQRTAETKPPEPGPGDVESWLRDFGY